MISYSFTTKTLVNDGALVDNIDFLPTGKSQLGRLMSGATNT